LGFGEVELVCSSRYIRTTGTTLKTQKAPLAVSESWVNPTYVGRFQISVMERFFEQGP
jgi:hypothetical protein